VLANRGPIICDVDVANRDEVTICWLLRIPTIEAFPPVILDVVKERTFATVCPSGKANVFIIFHVFASLEDNVSDAYGFDTTILLVPSVNLTPFVVLTMMDCGEERVPSESRIETVRPAGV
jgi:hypothetical protein